MKEVDPPGFWSVADEHPERTGVVADDGARGSFGSLRDRAHQIANSLRELGLAPGDVVATLLPNDPAFVEWFLATREAGLYLAPINNHLTGPEVAAVLEDSGAKVFVSSEAYADAARAAADAGGLEASQRLAVGEVEGFRSVAPLLAEQPAKPPSDPNSGALMLYTGGTTGRPKGVRRPLPEEDPYTVSRQSFGLIRAFRLQPGDGVNLTVCPLYHAGPLAFFGPTLDCGHTQVLLRRFDPERLLATIEREHVTSVYLVPTMFHRLLALPEETRRRYDLSSLRHVWHAAAPCPVEVKRRMLEWWGPVIWETYGGSEGAATIVSPKRWLERPGTVGRAILGVDLRILRDDGSECAPGEPGTIYIDTGKRAFRYHNDDEQTERAFVGSAFTLGDVGRLDEDGYLFLLDRKKDMIISGGVNVYPAEIEAVLLEHGAVGDVAVIGVPNEEWGEEVRAVVQPKTGVTATDELASELVEHCRERLAHYKCPRAVDFRDRLPRADNGKLYKRRLRDEYWTGSGRQV